MSGGLPDGSDDDLMARIQAGDAAAFSLLYDRLAPRAFRIAFGVLSPYRERADDVVQEAFLSAWRSRDQYQPKRGAVNAWVFGLVLDRALDARQSNGRDDRRSRMDGAVEDGRERRDLLSDLPEDQREVIVLALYGELRHSEIATELGLPVDTVKGRMRLGLDKMRDRLVQ